MAYCSKDDLLEQVSEAELIRLSDDAATGQADEAVARPALEAIRANFAAGGRPQKWLPLAASTKRQRGSGARPLIDSGRLMGSIRARMRAGRLVLSTSLPYARRHQFGGRGVPARPFLVLPAAEVRRLARLLAAALAGRAAR